MRIGDILIYIGEHDELLNKYEKFVLVIGYDDSMIIGVQLYGSDDEDHFYIRRKSNFITIKEYRKQKITKINSSI